MILTGSNIQGLQKEINKYLLAQLAVSKEKMLFPKIMGSELFLSGYWEDVRGVYSNVAADYMAFDSETPVKTNPSEEAVNGKIPKIGLKRGLNESYMESIEKMLGSYSADAIAEKITIVQRLNIDSALLRLEFDTMRALSHGVISVNNGNNVNLDNVRVDYHIPATNKFGVAVANTVTYQDVKNMLRKADELGLVGFVRAYTDSATLEKLGADEGMRKAYATRKALIAVPEGTLDVNQINEVFAADGIAFIKATEKIRLELKGVRTNADAWKSGVITFVPEVKAGLIAHCPVVEKRQSQRFNDGDIYTDIGDYSIMSVLSQTKDPYTIVSRLETRAVPILSNSDGICQIDLSKVEA